MVMSQPSLFISGIELANFVVSTDLVKVSWDANLAAYNEPQPQAHSVRWKIVKHLNFTIIAFVTSPPCSGHDLNQGTGGLASSESPQQANFSRHFDFLCSPGNPSFSIHSTAVDLFDSRFNELVDLRSQLVDDMESELILDTPLVITGHSLGGSVASLFTLSILDKILPKYPKLPFCITFGSPLLGDQGFQQAISEHSRWNSCFLHIVSHQDPVPRLFISAEYLHTSASTSQANSYKPFGTFLFCSEMGCACLKDPEVVLSVLLEGTRSRVTNDVKQVSYYEDILKCLNSRVCFRGTFQVCSSVADPLQEGINTELEAIRIRMVQQQQSIVIQEESKDLEIWATSPSRRLNESKKKMALLEWYKKKCKAQGVGYYDGYKNQFQRRDHDVEIFRKYLNDYWEKTVIDSAKKPQKEGAYFRTQWLYAGTNYRRMVEPLDIAEYYRKGDKTDYENNGRSPHYKLLQTWEEEEQVHKKKESTLTDKKKKNVAGILTEDSLFWAKVEEARICCKLLKNAAASAAAKKEASMLYLQKFESYVMIEVSKYALSPEIFLAQSSFMKWWSEFQEIGEAYYTYNASLLDFMNNAKYKRYEVGEY